MVEVNKITVGSERINKISGTAFVIIEAMSVSFSTDTAKEKLFFFIINF
jgi:hypothetical protein